MEYIHQEPDGTTVKYTDEMIKDLIISEKWAREKHTVNLTKVNFIRSTVHDFFEERYDDPSEQTDIICTVDDVNALLKEIDADILKSSYCVEGRITFSISGIVADNEDEASDLAYNNVRLEYDDEGELGDDWSVEITSISRD
jgi:hypothetical protein